jgi:hypothetical protein
LACSNDEAIIEVAAAFRAGNVGQQVVIDDLDWIVAMRAADAHS